MDYKSINETDLRKYFKIEEKNEWFELNISNRTKPIYIKLPFALNEDVSTLMGLMPDGSLLKDLMRIFFTQKKDPRKIDLFNDLIIKLFSSQMKLFRKENLKGKDIYINSKTLGWFFYFILKLPKSDEQMRVPQWIFNSPRNVKIEYLKQAFDMEGTVLKKLTEIRFVSGDELFAEDIKLLLSHLEIKSSLTYAPRKKQPNGQYRVSIYGRENFKKFKEIGYRIPFLENRFNLLLQKYELL